MPDTLPVQSSKRSMNSLLLGVLLSHLGTYMIAPLLPIFLKLNKGLPVTEIGLVLAAASIIVIFLQSPISRWILNRIPSLFSLGFGMLFIGAGLGSLYWSTSFYSLLASGVIFIIGEMLIVPTIDSTVSVMANARMIGVFC